MISCARDLMVLRMLMSRGMGSLFWFLFQDRVSREYHIFIGGDLVTYSCHKSGGCQDGSCVLSSALSKRLEAFHVAHNLGCGAAAIWVRIWKWTGLVSIR